MAFTRITPDTKLKPLPQASPSAGNYLSGGAGGQGGQSEDDSFRMLLSAAVAAGGISPSAGTFISSALLPPKETASSIAKKNEARASKSQAYDKATRLTNEALAILNQKNSYGGQKNVSGFSIPQFLQEKGVLPEWLPFGWGLNEDRAALSAKLGQLSGITAFDEAGKALTATELGIVGGKIPTAGKGEGTNREILEQVLADVEAKRNEYLFSQVGL